MPEEYYGPLKFIVLFGLNAGGAALLAARLRPGMGGAARAAAAAVFSVMQIIVITGALGCAGALGFRRLLAAQAGAFAVIAATAAMKRCARSETPACAAPRFSGPWQLGLLAVIIIFGSYMLLWAVVSPPPSSDSFLYHLAIPVKWIQSGGIFPDQSWPFGLAFHPSNPETVLLWLMLPLREDSFANLISCAFWLLAGLGVFALSGRLGAGRTAALAGAAVWLFLPLSSRMAPSSEVDHFAAFFFIAALVFLLEFRATKGNAELALGGMSLGIYLGSKFIALAFSAPVAVLFAWAILSGGSKARRLATFAIAVAVPCALWYALNYVLTGNPLFPLDMSLFGNTMAHGPVTREYVLSRAQSQPALSSFGPVFTSLAGGWMSLLLGVAAVVAVAGKISAGKLLRACVLALPLLLAALYVLLGCLNQENSERYLLPAAAAACAAWAVAVPPGRAARWLYFMVSALCLAVAFAAEPFAGKVISQSTAALAGRSSMPDLVPAARSAGAAIITCAAGIFLALATGKKSRGSAAALVAIAALSMVFMYPAFSDYYRKTKYHWYRASNPGLSDAWLAASNIYPKPLNIGVAGTNLYHGFHGVDFSNRVFNLNYGGRKRYDDYSIIEDLYKYDIFVFAYMLPRGPRDRDTLEGPRPTPIFETIAANPEIFRPAVSFGDVRLYIINKPGRGIRMEAGSLGELTPWTAPAPEE